MNPNNRPKKHGQLSLIFISVTLVLILIAFSYFYNILQPRLHQEAQNQSALLINSISQDLMQRQVIEDAFLLQREISKILLYSSEQYQQPYIKGLKIEFNPDLFPHHTRPLQRGKTQCKHCFEISKQLYCNSTNELIANVRFLINPVNYQRMINDITQKFFLFLGVLVLLLLVIWFSTRRLFIANLNTQDALKKANEYNQKILNTLQDWVLVINDQGRIINANQAASADLNIFNNAPDNLFIQQFVTAEKTQQPLMNLIKQPTQELQQNLIEVKIKTGHQTGHYGLLTCSRFIDPDQALSSQFLVVIKDVQALKIAESKLAYQAQMAHASRLKSLGEMAAGIAHEINQPLAVIRLGAEGIKQTLSRQNPDAFEVEMAQDMIDQVDRASLIIDNMRSFSRQKSTEKQWISAHTPLNNALGFFREPFRIQGITLVEQIDTGCPEIKVEIQKFEQVLVNLLTNARQALEKTHHLNPKITIKLQCDQQKVTLIIEDNGCGMDETTRQHCLDPFFTTKEAGDGTGLGLSIVDNILHELKIELIIESELAKGARFILHIPHKMTDNQDD
ncbi:PAS domain-containing sensor histidine kinase [Thiomicrospira microaerophila]|uniref:PAS domain-containing sensor histidine kinase n=1 Tax=Thiomicrospira microaerophila TaxID=406020 RepID=UPI0005C9E04A|nr:ATP-binding protein [Thiomicrospira microaerophila]